MECEGPPKEAVASPLRKESEPELGVSYAESGHTIQFHKENGPRVVRRPPTIKSQAWQDMSSAERLRALNLYRKPRRLRIAYNWEDMDVYLKEEHLRAALPSDHVYPWGAKLGTKMLALPPTMVLEPYPRLQWPAMYVPIWRGPRRCGGPNRQPR